MKSHIIKVCANGRVLVTAQVSGELRPDSVVSFEHLQLRVVKEQAILRMLGAAGHMAGVGGAGVVFLLLFANFRSQNYSPVTG